MTGLRIGSLCSGTGALDMAVAEVFGGEPAWFCQWEPPAKDGKPDKWQYAARILAHHWPDVPNHGDLTQVDWSEVEPVDVLGMGFPCTDVSSAGLRAGIAEGTRSGVWIHCARAIRQLRPKLVVIENVEGLLSARADRGVGATDADVEAAGDDALRALGCVLGDLADLGYDTEWCRVAASEVGAPHRRYRIIILARLAHADCAGLEGRRVHGPTSERLGAVADSADLGHERGGSSRERRTGPAYGDLPSADAAGERHGHAGPAGERGLSTPSLASVAWGPYGTAVARWERVLGRPAPLPVDNRGRLSPLFVEWMMGLPEGHVCDVPAPEGMSAAGLRNARLKALGNGVVPAQAAYALRLLLDRMGSEEAA